MPTGYTAYIEDEKITTGEEFLKLCTRAFGIAIDLKDKPLNVPTKTHFEADSYYKEKYEKSLELLEETKNMSFDEAANKRRKDYEEEISFHKEYAKSQILLNEKYEKVRKEVSEWIPPTDAHKKLKKFALNQIDICVTPQRHIDEYLEKSKENFDDSDKATYEYISDIISMCQKDVDRAYESYQEELKRTEEKNEWMKQFLESFKGE